jgi:purine-binding chemotaxis protein CheW
MTDGSNEQSSDSKSAAGRFLIFTLAQKPFAIPLMKVKEVIAFKEVTPIPQAPAYFRGVMNLRGLVITVLDLKNKLSISSKTESNETSVIILDMGDMPIGVMVDSVDSVASFQEGDISPPPSGLAPGTGKHLSGVAKRANDLVLIMDPDCILGAADQKIVRQSQAA